jgi:hypothetical protein
MTSTFLNCQRIFARPSDTLDVAIRDSDKPEVLMCSLPEKELVSVGGTEESRS